MSHPDDADLEAAPTGDKGRTRSSSPGAPGDLAPAPSPEDPEGLDWLVDLERELAELAGQSDLGSLERAERLAVLEGAFLEGVLRAPTVGASAIAPLLWADLERWSDRLGDLELPRASELARRPVLQWKLARHDRWLASAGTALASGSLVELAQAIEAAPDSDPSALEGAGSERDPGSVERKLAQLRADFLRQREFSELPVGVRRHWAATELDHAAEALTAIDELPLERAIGHLEACLARLDWFVDAIEGLAPNTRLRLGLRRRRLRAEIQERALQATLEARFGVRAIANVERLVFVLILTVLGILACEAFGQVDAVWARRFLWIDTAACGVFLFEFFTKLYHVHGKGRWFARHLLIDFVPSLPFGLLLHVGSANPLEAGRLARLFRLSRIARYMRPLLPVIRLVRALGFMARGVDRVVRAHRAALNRDLVLTPNRQERGRARARALGLRARSARVQARLRREWRAALEQALRELREELARRRSSMLEALVARHGEHLWDFESDEPETEERTLQETLDALECLTGGEVVASLGAALTNRLARGLKLMARSPLRWLPILRKILPEGWSEADDGSFVAISLRKLAGELERHHGRLYWFTDLYGTITPSELVDRTGSALVKSSIRPASRLLLFGGAYVLLMGVLQLVGVDAEPGPRALEALGGTAPGGSEAGSAFSLVHGLHGLKQMLERFVGPTLIVLGSVCLAILGIGFWLKRLAQDATSFFEQAGSAQFLQLTEVIRSRHIERDSEILARRVLDPELKLHSTAFAAGTPAAPAGLGRGREAGLLRQALADKVAAWLTAGRHPNSTGGRLQAVDRVALLYRDSLNGSLFGESDTRTTTQLLGNPALLQMRQLSTRVSKREKKQLQALDLEKSAGLHGPYLWFSLLSRSVARSASRLIVEYNRNALTLDELRRASAGELERHAAWIRNHPANSGPGPALREQEASDPRSYRGSEFNAFHFLDDDPARDRDIEQRFGPEVLALLRHDRTQLFCRIFGTYPLHLRPRSERTLNLNRLYDDWMSGGRIFFLPLRLAALGAASLAQFTRLIARAAREIRDPRLRTRVDPRLGAEFDSAARKIDRLRGPVVRASLWQRARFDPEYLGLSIPGNGPPPLSEEWNIEADLAFLGDDPTLRARVDDERRRARADLDRLRHLFEEGLLERAGARIGLAPEEIGPEHRRAIAIAYRADYDGFRSRLSARAILDELLLEAAPLPEDARRTRPRRGSRRAFERYCRESGILEEGARRSAWKLVCADLDGLQACLWQWGQHAEHGFESGVEQMAELLRHPGRVSDQLVTLRCVQTLALIDVLLYREHVWRLGCFAEVGDEADRRLQLMPS